MQSGDSAYHCTHPIFATFVGDYPEQLLVTCCKNFQCPKYVVDRHNLGNNKISPPRDLIAILDALNTINDGPTAYAKACVSAGIKPVYEPFWQHLPYVDIFQSITPDILHQLYQGVIKHLLLWLKQVFGVAEIDARCQCLPPNHNLRHFSKGITSLSRVLGKEHGDMCHILLRLVVDLQILVTVCNLRSKE
jgi:Plavaka transposase